MLSDAVLISLVTTLGAVLNTAVTVYSRRRTKKDIRGVSERVESVHKDVKARNSGEHPAISELEIPLLSGEETGFHRDVKDDN